MRSESSSIASLLLLLCIMCLGAVSAQLAVVWPYRSAHQYFRSSGSGQFQVINNTRFDRGLGVVHGQALTIAKPFGTNEFAYWFCSNTICFSSLPEGRKTGYMQSVTFAEDCKGGWMASDKYYLYVTLDSATSGDSLFSIDLQTHEMQRLFRIDPSYFMGPVRAGSKGLQPVLYYSYSDAASRSVTIASWDFQLHPPALVPEITFSSLAITDFRPIQKYMQPLRCLVASSEGLFNVSNAGDKTAVGAAQHPSALVRDARYSELMYVGGAVERQRLSLVGSDKLVYQLPSFASVVGIAQLHDMDHDGAYPFLVAFRSQGRR